MALGEIGLNVDYFYNLTPVQFWNTVEGFRKRENEQFKNSWELARQIMWASLIPHQKKGSNLTPARVLSFPWEKTDGEIKKTEIKETEIEVATKNKVFWDRIDAIMEKDKTDC